jgi:hypothetical protein
MPTKALLLKHATYQSPRVPEISAANRRVSVMARNMEKSLYKYESGYALETSQSQSKVIPATVRR